MEVRPNELTIAAMTEGRLIRIIGALLDHAVYDEAKNDKCIAAVKAARKVVEESRKP